MNTYLCQKQQVDTELKLGEHSTFIIRYTLHTYIMEQFTHCAHARTMLFIFHVRRSNSLIVEQITSEVLIKKIPMLRSNLLFSDFRM